MNPLKSIYILLISCCIPVWGIAQLSLDRQVLGSTGNFSTVSNVSLSSTVGEAVVATAISGSIVLTQGFQQPDGTTSVGIADDLRLSVQYTVAPNPTQDIVRVELTTDKPITIGLVLMDVRGRRVPVPEQEIRVNGTKSTELDLQALADGVYTLALKDEAGNIFRTFKIQRIN